MTRPPEAQLIYEARMNLGLSFRQAGDKAGISEGSWRRTESAKKLVRTPETLARMARAVGVTADQLADAGRPDAARALTQLPAPARDEPPADIYELYKQQTEILRNLEEKFDRYLGREAREQEDDSDDVRRHRRTG